MLAAATRENLRAAFEVLVQFVSSSLFVVTVHIGFSVSLSLSLSLIVHCVLDSWRIEAARSAARRF